MGEDRRESRRGSPREFRDTRWSVIRAAGRVGTPEAHPALEMLCTTYREPVYTFIRWKWARGSEEEARDLTQGFFARLLAKNHEVAAVDEAEGKWTASAETRSRRRHSSS